MLILNLRACCRPARRRSGNEGAERLWRPKPRTRPLGLCRWSRCPLKFEPAVETDSYIELNLCALAPVE